MVHINSHVPFSLDKPTKADLAELRGEYRDAYSEMMNKSAHKWRKAYKKEEENDPELATERKEVKRAYDKVHHQVSLCSSICVNRIIRDGRNSEVGYRDIVDAK